MHAGRQACNACMQLPTYSNTVSHSLLYECNGSTSIKMENKKSRLSSLTIAELPVTAFGLGAEEL